MTIVLNNIVYDLKDFLFKNIVLTEDFGSTRVASEFLTKWISGGKEFEMQTSGSTGKPKKIILKRKWLETSALQTIELLNLWDEKVMCCLPLTKIGGLMMVIRSLAGGFPIHIYEPKANPMNDIEPNHTFTFISLVASQLITIFDSEESIKKLNRFKNILLGGSDINSELIQKIKSLKPNVYHTYGMTETCSHIALKKLNNGSWPHFKPNAYVDLKTNENGMLSIKGFQTGSEWVHTNDVVKLYENGNFDFIGRADFMINTGGYKVFPEQLEQKIASAFLSDKWDTHFAITSKPDEKWGEAMVLILDSSITMSLNEILEILKPSLEKYEMPKKSLKIESIPLNDSGKTDRLKLRQLVLSVS